jgi:hypothetical protein
MNELAGWSLLHSEDEKCGKCGMTEKKGSCCKDEHKSFQVKTEHQKADAAKFIHFIASPAVVSGIYVYTDNTLYNLLAITYPVSHAPPISAATPLFIQHCSFLI